MIELILWFLKIGAFSFGGGLAILPHIYEMAKATGWCSEEDVTNLISLSQMTPGPLACNIATFVGNRSYGVLGSIVAVISFIIPAVIFMSVFSKLISKAEKSKKFSTVMSMVRSVGYASIITGSVIIIKNALFYNPETLKLATCMNNINLKAVISCIVIYVMSQKYKISAVKTLGIGAVVGLLFQL